MVVLLGNLLEVEVLDDIQLRSVREDNAPDLEDLLPFSGEGGDFVGVFDVDVVSVRGTSGSGGVWFDFFLSLADRRDDCRSISFPVSISSRWGLLFESEDRWVKLISEMVLLISTLSPIEASWGRWL